MTQTTTQISEIQFIMHSRRVLKSGRKTVGTRVAVRNPRPCDDGRGGYLGEITSRRCEFTVHFDTDDVVR